MPEVTLRRDGNLVAQRGTLSFPHDRFASALELAAIAIDDGAHGLFAHHPVAWQRRLIAKLARVRDLRASSAAATVLLDLLSSYPRLRGLAQPAYLAILDRTRNTRLRDSMTFNLDRVKHLLDARGRAALDAAWTRVIPPAPPYQAWFAKKQPLRVLCQVQDVFFAAWRHEFRKLGFRWDGRRYVRGDIVVDYVEKGQGIFTAMADPRVDVVMFLGHSDWWARVPRNLARAPDQVGEKLLVLIMCFGKHFYHSLHERYPRAHIVTTRDPTEDPEDVAMLRHLFDGIDARKSWRAIRASCVRDARTADNFIFPTDTRYVAGVIDEDRDGRLDRFDRFCNVGAKRKLAPVGGDAGMVPDPPSLHPRGAELEPRELDGGPVLEAALMMNSLSYDNRWLDMVNQDQRVVAGGWHHAAPGDFACARFTPARQDGREIVRLTVSTRYARAPQPALTAMVVYEGWRYWAGRVPRAHRPTAREATLCGILLVAHALGNADYPRPDEVFHSWARRWGLPAGLSFRDAYALVESDEDWESGSRKSVAKFAASLSSRTLARIDLLDSAP